MIPKVIHYTWFSGEPFPELIQTCIDSWHQHLAGYEFILWDAERIKEIDSLWLKECLSTHKWAFAADYVRLYAIANYGGIYLDTDCLIYKPFDCFLKSPCFIGKEHSIYTDGIKPEQYLTSHCFGAEAHNEYIETCLAYYDKRHFILSENANLPMSLKYSVTLLPYIQSEIAKLLGYKPSPLNREIQSFSQITIYPSQYFDAINPAEGYCRHMALGSWREEHSQDQHITFMYKVQWRIEALVRRLLRHYDYLMIKLS